MPSTVYLVDVIVGDAVYVFFLASVGLTPSRKFVSVYSLPASQSCHPPKLVFILVRDKALYLPIAIQPHFDSFHRHPPYVSSASVSDSSRDF